MSMSTTPQSFPLSLRGLRGAPTCTANTTEAIEVAVDELIEMMIQRNALESDRVVSVLFSVTSDLNACFPAAVVRRRSGWDGVALLDCQQMAVDGDIHRCIRVLAHVWMPQNRIPVHPYLGEAIQLRPDLSSYT